MYNKSQLPIQFKANSRTEPFTIRVITILKRSYWIDLVCEDGSVEKRVKVNKKSPKLIYKEGD